MKLIEGQRHIFDPIRKKWLVLYPEEVVRQLLIIYLSNEMGYSKNHISVESGHDYNSRPKRCDLLIYGPDHRVFMLVECKAPEVIINEKQMLWQAAVYNLTHQVPYLMISNGQNNYCYALDHEHKTAQLLSKLPEYPAEI